MKTTAVKIALKSRLAYLIVMLVFGCFSVFAQKIDTNKIWLKPKVKVASRIPVIRGSVQPYRPSYNVLSSSNAGGESNREKSAKTLTILKIYPNPVVEQLNINLRLEKETNVSIKITDLLGNEIVTLSNEKMPAGEHTKTYNMPSKLNAGIYFLRIVAGGEPLIKRISVL
ncbi:T9SS type A sorting domain-containing protein [Pedobacter sp.]